ncbi:MULTISPECIES: hypothetical protein [unclassified Corynebacterium]|nr:MULTISPECIES: hypothetical protein [unclassified Corynebacterium]
MSTHSATKSQPTNGIPLIDSVTGSMVAEAIQRMLAGEAMY